MDNSLAGHISNITCICNKRAESTAHCLCECSAYECIGNQISGATGNNTSNNGNPVLHKRIWDISLVGKTEHNGPTTV